jgi:hypothetical protein
MAMQESMEWLAWEEIVEVVYPNERPAFDRSDAWELAVFLRDRNLLA